ncbi:hypothetical protein HanPSC8_Chr09g0403441 [Helianthus annuus]|nr:hypothetical protein HanPSC8_Chr09g0403441 [Helianthus annuus]
MPVNNIFFSAIIVNKDHKGSLNRGVPNLSSGDKHLSCMAFINLAVSTPSYFTR